jgi:hypothetical protein
VLLCCWVFTSGGKGVPAIFRGHFAAIKLASGIAGRLELGLFVKEFDAGTWLGNADSFDSDVFAKTCAWPEPLLAPQCSTVASLASSSASSPVRLGSLYKVMYKLSA